MLNKVLFGGRLTKDPELTYSPNGVAITKFTLAVDRNFKNAQGEKETDFIPHVFFKQGAELAANTLTKGSLINTDGRLQVRTYNDKDGQKRWVTEVVGENFYFMEPRGGNGGGDQQNQGNQSQLPPTGGSGSGGWGYGVNLDDDIPF